MRTRDTGTGDKFERKTGGVLRRSDITFDSQVNVGKKPGGGSHRVDHVVHRPDGSGQKLLVSCKTQSVGGTAEEKIPYEMMKLAKTVSENPQTWGDYAVLILDGDGWSDGIKEMVEKDSWSLIREVRNLVRVYYSADEFVEKEFPKHYVPLED
jgi:hypothetical protein